MSILKEAQKMVDELNAPVADLTGSGGDDEHLGVRRGVAPLLPAVVIPRHDPAVAVDEDGPDRDVPVGNRLLRLDERRLHGFLPVHYSVLPFYTPHPTEGSHSLA